MNISDADVYLRSLRDSIAAVQEESSASEKLLLASNVFEQIQEHIPSLATHQVLSKYIEKLIVLLAHSVIEEPENEFEEKQKLCAALATQLLLKADVEVLSKDAFGSHVLQSTLQCCTLFEHHGVDFSDALQHLATTVEDRCLFLLLHHVSGSHVLRSLIKALAGALDADAFQKSKRKSTDKSDALVHSKRSPDTGRLDRLKRWAALFCMDFNGSLASTQACATLCLLLKLCQHNNIDNTSTLCKGVITHALASCTYSKNASFAAEKCLEVCHNAEFNYAFKTFVLPRAQELSENMFGNYVVQAVIRHRFFQASHLESFLQEINIASLLSSSSSSIVWKLCQSAVTLGAGQSLFMKKLMDAVSLTHNRPGGTPNISDANRTKEEQRREVEGDSDVSDANESGKVNSKVTGGDYTANDGRGHIWLALVSCQPVESERIHLRATGTSILLYLLNFDRNIIGHVLSDFKHFLRIAKSQSAMITLATDCHFSRVLQRMLDRRQGLLKEKQILRLFKYLKPHFVEVALDINGAFVLSSLFNACPVKQQHELLAELAPEGERIKKKNRRFAEIIGLEAFVKDKNMWMNKRRKTESVRALFKDIIEPES